MNKAERILKNQKDRQEGFSLLEVMIVTVILVIVISAIFQVISYGLDSYNTGSVLVEIQGQARRTLDRIARELQSAGLDTISPTPPATGTPGTNTITYQRCEGNAGEVIQWGNVKTIAFAYSAGESDNGADDDNNGVIDDGIINLTEQVPGAPVTDMIGYSVQENGLTFNLDGRSLTIRIEMAKKEPRGKILDTYLETTVQIKN